jgi:tRNA G18 (ribose-2'-O)-methylase SpoU
LIVEIDDPSDPRVADYVGLTDPDLRRLRERSGGAGGGFFIAEGELVIRTLLSSSFGPSVRSLFLTPRRWSSLSADGVVPDDVCVLVAPMDVLQAVSGFHLHRGALASVDRPPFPSMASLCSDASLLVLTEGVNDHENLGALFRNAAAFGVDAVLLDPTSCDPLYRRAVRVSMGHVLRVPFAPLAGAAVDGVRALQRLGFEVIGLTPSLRADDVRAIAGGGGGGGGGGGPSARRARRALVVGAEGPGLTEGVLAACDRLVRIPMAPGVDSLNVATAVAVALHALRG